MFKYILIPFIFLFFIFCSENKKENLNKKVVKKNSPIVLIKEPKSVEEKKQVIYKLKLDTIFKYNFPALFNFNTYNNNLFFVVEENKLLYLEDNKEFYYGKLNLSYEIDKVLMNNENLFANYTVDVDISNLRIFEINSSFVKTYELVDFNIEDLIDEERILGIKDNRNKGNSNDFYEFNFFIYNFKEKKLEYEFSKNKNVIYSNNNVYEFSIDNMFHKEKRINKISSDLKSNNEIFFKNDAFGIPIYFSKNSCILRDSEKIIKIENGIKHQEARVYPMYNYKIKIENDKVYAYGWIDSDIENLSTYYFVKQDLEMFIN